MKILCVSDQIDPLIYSVNAKKNFADIDAVLCAGDLPMDYVDFIVTVLNKPTYFIFGNHDLKEFQYYHNVRQQLPRQDFPAEAVIHSSIAKHNHGAVYAGFKVLRNKRLSFRKTDGGKDTPLLIAGVSGSRKYNNGLNQYTDLEMMLRLLIMVPKLLLNKLRYGRFLDIFLSHATPLDIHDKKDPCHTGFKCYNWFIKTFKPEYMVHGHIHLYDQREERVGTYGSTTVVNAYAHCIIQFPKKQN